LLFSIPIPEKFLYLEVKMSFCYLSKRQTKVSICSLLIYLPGRSLARDLRKKEIDMPNCPDDQGNAFCWNIQMWKAHWYAFPAGGMQ
jgi:hypothetical protein